MMRFFLLFLFLLTLVSCETTKQFKSNDNNKKQKKILMKVKTKPDIKIKEWKYFQQLILKIKSVLG